MIFYDKSKSGPLYLTTYLKFKWQQAVFENNTGKKWVFGNFTYFDDMTFAWGLLWT